MSTLELYHWEPATDSAKVMMCLHEKGVRFDSHYVDVLKLEQYRPDFLAINPAAQVPVLVSDGTALTESTLINEFLAEAFPEPRLAPGDARGWYEALAWGKSLDYNLGPSVSMLGWQQVTAPRLKSENALPSRQAVELIAIPERKAAWQAAIEGYSEDQMENSRRKIALAVQRIEQSLADSGWLLGGAYSIVDIDAFALSRTLPQLTPEIVNSRDTPRMMEWLERINSRPAVQAALRMGRSGDDLYAPGPEHSRWG